MGPHRVPRGVTFTLVRPRQGVKALYDASRSSVLRCTHRVTGATYAVKAYKRSRLSPTELAQARAPRGTALHRTAPRR